MTEIQPKIKFDLRTKRPLQILGVIFLLILFILIIILFGQDKLYAGSLYPNTEIGGIQVGEMKIDEARDKLNDQVARYVEKTQITIVDKDKSWNMNPQDIGIEYDIAKSIQNADIHRSKKYFILRLQSLFGKTFEESLAYTIDQKKFDTYITSIDSEASTPYQNASLNIGKSGIEETQAKVGLVVDKIRLKVEILNRIAELKDDNISLPKNFISPKVQVKNLEQTYKQVEEISQRPIILYNYDFDKKYTIKESTLLSWLSFKEFLVWENGKKSSIYLSGAKKNDKDTLNDQQILYFSYLLGIPGIKYNLQVVLDDDKLNHYISDTIANDLNKDPVNVKLAFTNNILTVVEPEENGWEVDETALKVDLEEAIANSEQYVKISLEEVLADARVDNLDELGIKKVISIGKSNFAGSPRNRIHNIRVGASRYNGVLIKPDAVFSFNEILGKVDASTGYLPELVIKANKTVPEYGGGLCQVSTTTFRAALNAGLPIVERKNHAYPVSYYKWPYTKYGTDATIYVGGSDLKFRNNTGNWILIQTRIEGTILYYDFFGDTDGERRVELDMKEYGYGWRGAGSLKATVVYKVFVGDKMIHTQTFQSNYKSPSEFPHPEDEEKEEDKKTEETTTKPKPTPPPPTPPEEEEPPAEEG